MITIKYAAAYLDNGTPVPYEVTYSHPMLGPCSEQCKTRADAEKRAAELKLLIA